MRLATATRPGTSRSASAHPSARAQPRLARPFGSRAREPRVGARPPVRARQTRRARCGSPGRSGCTGDPVATGQKGGDPRRRGRAAARAPTLIRRPSVGRRDPRPSGRATSTTRRRKRPDSGVSTVSDRAGPRSAPHRRRHGRRARRRERRARSLLEEGASSPQQQRRMAPVGSAEQPRLLVPCRRRRFALGRIELLRRKPRHRGGPRRSSTPTAPISFRWPRNRRPWARRHRARSGTPVEQPGGGARDRTGRSRTERASRSRCL